MKTLVFILLLFFTVNAQTIWYVDLDATGNGSGTSWANASVQLRLLPWRTTMEGGDSVYISDGIYPAEDGGAAGYINLGTRSSDIIVAPAWEAGHTGNVIFRNTVATARNFSISYSSHIKFVNLTFEQANTVYGGSGVHNLLIQYSSNITFDACTVKSNGLGGTAYFGSCERITFTNGMIWVDNPTAYDSDPLGMSGGKGGHTITNNLIYYDATNPDGSNHRDIIQFPGLGEGYDDYLQTTIAGNFMWYPNNVAGQGVVGGLYSTSTGDQRYLVYNNIIMINSDQGGYPIWFDWYSTDTAYVNKVEIYNNTLISHWPSIVVIMSDTAIVKNNIAVKEDAGSYTIRFGSNPAEYAFMYKDVDYNFYYDQLGFEQNSNGTNHNWTQWQAAGFDIYGDTVITAPAILTVIDSTISSYYTTFGRDLGTDLSALIPAYDILGYPRGVNGVWDAGALEFGESQSNNVQVNSRIFLQGPFNSNSMSTILNQSSLLPNSQPYNSPPWNYNGNESFNTGSNSTIVDWVLVELRNTFNPIQVVARRAALLKNDGLLLETNGTEGVAFNNVDPGSYYIAVYHRNHLAIMSAAPVPLSSNSALYDFTTGMNKAYGQNPMVELVPGKYGMYATDGNGDGVVNTADRDDVWLVQNGNMGYLEGDFNMNSGVTVHDVNQLWNLNNGAVTRVP